MGNLNCRYGCEPCGNCCCADTTTKQSLFSQKIKFKDQLFQDQPDQKFAQPIKNPQPWHTPKIISPQYIFPPSAKSGKKLDPYILNNGQSIYNGQWKQGRMFGKGLLVNKNKGYFQGEMQPPLGRYVFQDGSYFQGQIKGGKQSQITQLQKLIFNFDKNKIEDYGKYVWPDGTIYQGQFRYGNLHGKGKIIYPNNCQYQGDWVNNQMQGIGILKCPQGGIYNGQFKNNKRHGKGIFEWPNKQRYEGKWQNGLRQGFGKLFLSNGNILKGEWHLDNNIIVTEYSN